MSGNLEGRVAIVTGATGGMGRAIVTEFYKQGATVIMTGRDIDKLNTLRDTIVKKVPSMSPKTPAPTGISLDLTATDVEKTLIDYTIRTANRLDILVNNAGNTDGQMFLKTSHDFLNRVMHINFTTPYFIMQAALTPMLKNRYGRIINITSIAGHSGDAGLSAYAASKGALAAASKSIAVEYGRRNITVNCVAPGTIDTDAVAKIPEAHQAEIKSAIPLRRYGKPEEVAALVAFLASEQASYINGQQILIDGGLIR